MDAREALFGAAVVTDLNRAPANMPDVRDVDDTVRGIRRLNTALPGGSGRTD